jgi:hypothetical protein
MFLMDIASVIVESRELDGTWTGPVGEVVNLEKSESQETKTGIRRTFSWVLPSSIDIN